jgi:hypothetical protein
MRHSDDGLTPLITESLEQGLSRRRGRPVRIRSLDRDMLSRSSSFRTELLCVTTDDGEPALDRELDALLDGRTVPAAIERAGRDRG